MCGSVVSVGCEPGPSTCARNKDAGQRERKTPTPCVTDRQREREEGNAVLLLSYVVAVCDGKGWWWHADGLIWSCSKHEIFEKKKRMLFDRVTFGGTQKGTQQFLICVCCFSSEG